MRALTLPPSRLENATAPLREALRMGMGRYPAEIAEGAEVYREGEKGPTSEPFSTTALVN